VKRVKLTIWGANVNYVLRARNVKGTVVASAIVTPTCCKTTKAVEVKGSQITDVTFGLDKSITAVTQIEYEV
jgi:xanthine/uracil/vitamin C permease (AzgA family)